MNKNKGFTLLELLVVIAIIGILASIIMAMLGSSKNKGNDSRVQSQLKSMVSQAQLYTGASTAVTATTTAISGANPGNLFTSTLANNSLYRLTSSLPSGTVVYYGKDGNSPLAGGLWAFAASTSNGSVCIDYTGVLKSNTAGTSMTTVTASTHWVNLAGSFAC